jgi:cytochrome c-type biogenesis protein
MVLLEEFVTTFLLGIGAPIVSPCLLPLYPGFLAYLSGRSKASDKKTNVKILGVLVFLGVITMMLFLGFVIAALSISVGKALSIITPLAYIVIIILGVLLLFNKNIFESIPKIRMPGISNPYVNAYVYGLLYGPIALPCSGPVAVSIFALSFGVADVASKILLFFVFGLGFGLPLILLSILSGSKQSWLMSKFTKNYKLINRVAGILLIVIGIYEIYINFDTILLFLG